MKPYVKYLIALVGTLLAMGVFYVKVYVPKSTYEIISPSVGDLEVSVKGIGNVSALNIYTITAQTGGKILELFVDEGAWVKKGDLLIVMDGVDLARQLEMANATLHKSSFDVAAAKSELKNLNAQKELLQITHKRYLKLKEQGFVSQSEFDKSDAELKGSNAAIEVATSRINAAKAALAVAKNNLQAIEEKMRRLKVYSPIDGYVVAKDAQVAQSVLSSTSIFTIVDPSGLWVEMKIDERISSQIKLDQNATIMLRSQADKLYKARVKRIVSISDSVTLEREIDVAFESLPTPFYINEQAEVRIAVETLVNVVKIPANALARKDGVLGVWLLEDSRAKFHAIEKIAQNDEEIAVANLEKRSKIVVPNAKKKPLSDGAKVYK